MYRALAVIAAEGVNHLPKYCLAIAGALMGGAVLVDLLKDFVVPIGYKQFVPIPSAVSIPFFIGAPIAIDFCLGGAVMLVWCAFLTPCCHLLARCSVLHADLDENCCYGRASGVRRSIVLSYANACVLLRLCSSAT